jgi:methionyl-tRNA formyltransferase
MRIVFFGATDMGYRCCEALLDQGQDVVGIVTVPERFRISYSMTPVTNVLHRSFAPLAQRHRIPMMRVDTRLGDAQYLDQLQRWDGEFALVIGWYHLIPSAVRQRFSRGVAGIHASLLPKYRGGAPLVWALINGETETGVTLFYFDDTVDGGDIIAQRQFPIRAEDTIATLQSAAIDAAVSLVSEQVPRIRQGDAARVPQDSAVATVFPQRTPEDGEIDWTRSAVEIRNFIRAQTRPYPGAFTLLNGKKITIWDADVVEIP